MKAVRLCSIDGCGRKHNARGLCRAHYARRQAHGDPQPDIQLQARRARRRCLADGCDTEGCERSVRCAGLCGPHYWQKRMQDPGARERERECARRRRERDPEKIRVQKRALRAKDPDKYRTMSRRSMAISSWTPRVGRDLAEVIASANELVRAADDIEGRKPKTRTKKENP